MPRISLQRVIRSTSCLVLEWGFRDGGSNGAISGSNKSKMAAAAILEKFQMAISPQPVVRSTSCFVLRWVFRWEGARIVSSGNAWEQRSQSYLTVGTAFLGMQQSVIRYTFVNMPLGLISNSLCSLL